MAKQIYKMSDDKCSVTCGKITIAKSIIGRNGCEIVMLQGVPKEKVLQRIKNECPDFLTYNNFDETKVIRNFA